MEASARSIKSKNFWDLDNIFLIFYEIHFQFSICYVDFLQSGCDFFISKINKIEITQNIVFHNFKSNFYHL